MLDETVCVTRQEGDIYLYGIFDGHSGSKVAAFAAQRMPEEILLGQLHGKVTDDEIKDVLKQVSYLQRINSFCWNIMLIKMYLSFG